MRAFNKRKHKGVKKYKSYTHLGIWYENCEYWTIPLKYTKFKMKDGFIEHIKINTSVLEIDKWSYRTPELRLKRLTEEANDIVSVSLIRVNKKRNYGSWSNEPRHVLPIQHYIDANPYSCYSDNLLQSTEFKGIILTYSWEVDKDIKVIHPYNFEKGSIYIPSKYTKIIDRLDKDVWDVKEI